MEYPRPSPNFGKWISTRAAAPSRCAIAPGSSDGSSRITSPASSSGDGGFWTMRRPLMSVAIDFFLERFGSDAMHDVDEAFGVAVPVLEVALDQPLDDVGDIRARKGRAQDLA